MRINPNYKIREIAGERIVVNQGTAHVNMTRIISFVRLFVTPWTIDCQASLSMEFPRKEYWSGLPFLSPGALPDSGTEPTSLASPALSG